MNSSGDLPTCAAYGTRSVVGNGTDALVLALRVLGIAAGDEVITSRTRFVASTAAMRARRSASCLTSILGEDLNIDVTRIRVGDHAPHEGPSLPVHLTGRPVEMKGLMSIARRRGLRVVEDCAQAVAAGMRRSARGLVRGFRLLQPASVETLECLRRRRRGNDQRSGARRSASGDAEHRPEKPRRLRGVGGQTPARHAASGDAPFVKIPRILSAGLSSAAAMRRVIAIFRWTSQASAHRWIVERACVCITPLSSRRNAAMLYAHFYPSAASGRRCTTPCDSPAVGGPRPWVTSGREAFPVAEAQGESHSQLARVHGVEPNDLPCVAASIREFYARPPA